MPRLVIKIDVPRTIRAQRVVSDLQSWLRRYGLDIASWQLEDSSGVGEEMGPAVPRWEGDDA